MSTRSNYPNTVLKIAELTFAYKQANQPNKLNSWAINNLSLNVNEGEIVCILGASGCGKSTLLNLIAGLLQPDSGKIELINHGTSKKRIGYIFQDDALFPWRTVESNLMLAIDVAKEISKESAQERIGQYLSMFHLDHQILKQYPTQLSGGMRQRVSIIQSLMFNPELLLLDEPFSALDLYTKLKLEGEFYQLVKEKRKAAILVTHNIEESIAMADRILIMDKAGNLTSEFKIDLEDGARSPENVRGMPKFAELYRAVWQKLKTVIMA